MDRPPAEVYAAALEPARSRAWDPIDRPATWRERMKNVLRVLLLIVVILCVVIWMQPDQFHVQRSVVINAPADSLVARVSDLHRWVDWAPWDKYDPQMKRMYEGAPSGVGASYHWAGNNKVGEGRMTVTDMTPGRKVGFKVEFIKPFAATNDANFDFAPEGNGTKVTWSIQGHENFVGKAMCMIMNPDKMIGPDFEEGLAKLKKVSEAGAAPAATTPPAGT
jgi:hypothetical protein